MTVRSLFDLGDQARTSPAQDATQPATAARDQAIQRVHDGATIDERESVRAALDTVIQRSAQQGTCFTSEHVIAELGDAYALIREPRLLGAIIQRAYKQGRIVPGAYVAGQRAERHKAPVRQWWPTTSNGSPADAVGVEEAAE
jgi:hypothetical protein